MLIKDKLERVTLKDISKHPWLSHGRDIIPSTKSNSEADFSDLGISQSGTGVKEIDIQKLKMEFKLKKEGSICLETNLNNNDDLMDKVLSQVKKKNSIKKKKRDDPSPDNNKEKVFKKDLDEIDMLMKQQELRKISLIEQSKIDNLDVDVSIKKPNVKYSEDNDFRDSNINLVKSNPSNDLINSLLNPNIKLYKNSNTTMTNNNISLNSNTNKDKKKSVLVNKAKEINSNNNPPQQMYKDHSEIIDISQFQIPDDDEDILNVLESANKIKASQRPKSEKKGGFFSNLFKPFRCGDD